MKYLISFRNTKDDIYWINLFSFTEAIEIPFVGKFIKEIGENKSIKAIITIGRYRKYTISTK